MIEERRDPQVRPVRRVGVMMRPGSHHAYEVIRRFAEASERHGLELRMDPFDDLGPIEGVKPLEGAEDKVDLLLTLGGDGTLLRGARRVAGRGIPVLGVNLGRLGFLTSVPAEGLDEAILKVARGEYFLDVRSTLVARLVRGGQVLGEPIRALNDFVLHNAGVARVVHLDLHVDTGQEKEEIGSFSGDGVILSSPTGSTAYSLSTGGPIVAPSVDCLLVTPVSPHTLSVRPLVLPGGATVSIRAMEASDQVVLTADGQEGVRLATEDEVRVACGGPRVFLVRFEGHTFFSTLRRKLNWAI